MQGIADAAGVSRATVSRALRNDPRLSVATRERVIAVAKNLGYRPNPLVSTLMAQLRTTRPTPYTGTLAFITNDAAPKASPLRARLVGRLLSGAVERAGQFGYRIEEFRLSEPGLTPTRAVDILKARGVHGLLLAPAMESRQVLEMDSESFAVAAIGYSMWHPVFHIAVNHQAHSLKLAMRTLMERGYRRIGLALDHDHDVRTDCNWSGAFLAFQQDLPAANQVSMLRCGVLNKETLAEWLARARPDAVVSPVFSVPNWLRELGIPIPKKLGFATLHRQASPDCAGVDQRSDLVAAAAVDLVLAQLYRNERGVPTHPKVVLVEGQWVDGPTVRPNGVVAGRKRAVTRHQGTRA